MSSLHFSLYGKKKKKGDVDLIFLQVLLLSLLFLFCIKKKRDIFV